MASVKQISVQELEKMFQQNKAFLLLDVRDTWELEEANLKDRLQANSLHMLNIPVRQLESRIKEVPSDTAVVCLCHHGGRSKQAALMLEYAGYPEIFNVVGGIHEWAQQIDSGVPVYD
jgi:rhodanese-related sulfurtransferase